MLFRVTSLKTRTALAIASVIGAILVANAVYLILAKREELKRDTEKHAELFAQLTHGHIAALYETNRDAGPGKLQELMNRYLDLEPDVQRILVADLEGRVLFDSGSRGGSRVGRADGPGEDRIRDPARLAAIRGAEATLLRLPDSSGEDFEIVAPHLEEGGGHRLSVSYRVSYGALRPGIRRVIYATGGLTLFSLVASVLVVMALASRITRPLQELTAGAKGIAEGQYGRRLDLRSRDELQVLAETFNHMSERLKQNVEQLEDSNRKLAGANEELQELDRMKSDLLANVSHELRTPLTAIKGYTDYILDGRLGPITDKQERGLVVVQRNLERLAKSINALLDYSRMETGRLALNVQPFGLAQLVEQIVTTLRSELERKGISFGSRVPADLPPVIADRERISQVIENLVINALKFTPEGGRITVDASRCSLAGRPAAEIVVSDTGIGIPEGQIGKVFTRFHQVDGSSTRRFGGVGLGLAIVKSILDAHGSAIAVESEVGRGTTFRFSLPVLEKDAEAALREERAPAPYPEAARGPRQAVS